MEGNFAVCTQSPRTLVELVNKQTGLSQKAWVCALRPLLITESSYNWRVKVKVAQSCLTLCDRMDYTIHRILQARILEWVAFPFSRGTSQPRDGTQVSLIAGGFFTSWGTREARNWRVDPAIFFSSYWLVLR